MGSDETMKRLAEIEAGWDVEGEHGVGEHNLRQEVIDIRWLCAELRRALTSAAPAPTEPSEAAIEAALGSLPGAVPATSHERFQVRNALRAAYAVDRAAPAGAEDAVQQWIERKLATATPEQLDRLKRAVLGEPSAETERLIERGMVIAKQVFEEHRAARRSTAEGEATNAHSR